MLLNIFFRILDFYQLMIVIYCVLSWFPGQGFIAQAREALGMLCEPYLSVFRSIIPPLGMVDISPVVAVVVLQIIERLLWALLVF